MTQAPDTRGRCWPQTKVPPGQVTVLSVWMVVGRAAASVPGVTSLPSQSTLLSSAKRACGMLSVHVSAQHSQHRGGGGSTSEPKQEFIWGCFQAPLCLTDIFRLISRVNQLWVACLCVSSWIAAIFLVYCLLCFGAVRLSFSYCSNSICGFKLCSVRSS